MQEILIIVYSLGAFIFSAYEYAGIHSAIPTIVASIIWPVMLLWRFLTRLWWTIVGYFIEH